MRARPVALIALLAASVGIAVWSRPSAPEAPFDWSWRASEPVLFDSSPPPRAAGVQIAAGSDATFAAELLAASGVVKLAISPVSAGGSGPWLVPGSTCAAGAGLLERGSGDPVVFAGVCEPLLAALGLASPTPWQAEGAVALPDAAPALVLPLPAEGLEWGDLPTGWTSLARREGGGVVAARNAAGIAVLAFDLLPFLRRVRQGDPALADLDRDGLHGVKTNDLRPFPWDERVWVLPGVDLWGELLWAALGAPDRFWPLPTTAPSAVVLTLDQDFVAADWLVPVLSRIEDAGGEATLLTTFGTRQTTADPVDGAGGELPTEELAAWEAWGHGVGLHPNTAGLTPPRSTTEALRLHAERLPDATSIRHHFLHWWGYGEPIEEHARANLWIELNAVSIEPRFSRPGFGSGSARPMRFCGDDGQLLPVLSQPTQLEDDVLYGGLPYSHPLDLEGAIDAAGRMMDVAIELRVPVTVNVHPGLEVQHQGRFLQGLLDAAAERDLPVLSAERLAVTSWARLRASVLGETTPGVPLLRWSAGSECTPAVEVSPFGPSGCLSTAGAP